MSDKNFDIEGVMKNFAVSGDYEKAEPYGNGHINDTFAVYYDNGRAGGVEKPFRRVLLQRINQFVFKQPGKLMENVERVTKFLKDKIIASGGDYLRETLNLIPSAGGGSFYKDPDGNYWRVYYFIEDAVSYETIESGRQMYLAGKAFGNFQKLLSDFPADTLHESIPNFHHTPKRYENFIEAIKNDAKGRARDVTEEIEFVMARKDDTEIIQKLIETGDIPLRVTHNDTKVNNVMFDTKTGEPVCVVDLDTIMPGSMLFDFGDSVRFGANPAAEDELDLSVVNFSFDYYEEFKKGFMEELGGSANAKEKELLPAGAKLMTLECGMRFLTDHLNGDVYFKIHRPSQNLDRARTQFKLVSDMEKIFYSK